jgi:hypothetical protein
MTPNDAKSDRSQNASTETLTVKPRQAAPKRNSILVPLLIAVAAHVAVLGGIAYYYMKNHPATAGKAKAPAPADDLKVAEPVALPAPATSTQAVDADSAAPDSAVASSTLSSADTASKSSASASPAGAPAKAAATAKPKVKPTAKPAAKAKTARSAKSTKASKSKTAAKPASKKAPPKPAKSLDLDALSKINHKPTH